MIQELYQLINNDKHIMSANDIAYSLGVLRTILTLYREEPNKEAVTATESRRTSQKQPKQRWWEKF